jgi:hypothetical protein
MLAVYPCEDLFTRKGEERRGEERRGEERRGEERRGEERRGEEPTYRDFATAHASVIHVHGS